MFRRSKLKFPKLNWNAPEQWSDPKLAKFIRDNSPKSKKYNLYHDLCRAVTRSQRISGNMVELKLIVSGSLSVPLIGPEKQRILGDILNGWK